MSVDKLELSDTLSGFVIDGVEHTPYVVGTLKRDGRAIEVEVPYIPGLPSHQFDYVANWFDSGVLPTNTLFQTKDGWLGLFGCRISGRTMSNVSSGRFRPSEVVLRARDGNLQDPLVVTEVQSTLDGLGEWSRFTATKQETTVDDQSLIQKLSIVVESADEFTWQQGEATMTIKVHWSGDNAKPGVHVDEWVVLSSKFSTARPFLEHLTEQRKVRSLVSLMLGSAIRFRKHEIRDSRFTVPVGDGTRRETFSELLSVQTVGEYDLPIHDRSRSHLEGLAFLPQLKPGSLTKWAAIYEDWSRMIDPTAGLYSRSGLFVEDIVISTNLSLEAAGHLLPEGPDEAKLFKGKSTARHVFRCLASLDLDWSDAADSIYGLAQAVADNYNTIKHYDRGTMPPNQQSYLIGNVSLLVVRLLALNLLDDTGDLVKANGNGWLFQGVVRNFRESNWHIEGDGNFVPVPTLPTGLLPNGITLR